MQQFDDRIRPWSPPGIDTVNIKTYSGPDFTPMKYTENGLQKDDS